MKKLLWLLFNIFCAMISYTINGSIFWSIMSFIFSPIALIKWMIYKEINMSVIEQTFSFLQG